MSDLAIGQRVSASTQNQALAALNFLYETVLHRPLFYGSGLRILECVSLRVKDVDIDRREITVRGGKSDQDRRAPLAESAVLDVKRVLRSSYRLWSADRRSRIRVTGIEGAVARKPPNADEEWPSFYVFPATRAFVDSSGVRRRHHLHETQVQRAVRAAEARLSKRVTCHSFRHTLLALRSE